MNFISLPNSQLHVKGYIMVFMMLISLVPHIFSGNRAQADDDIDYSELSKTLAQKTWSGDLNEMVKRDKIRVLVANSKTFYFIDKGQQRGLSYDMVKQFEKFIHEKLGAETQKLKVVFIPVKRDQLLQKLAEGYGDIAAANLTITHQRLQDVDFSTPFATGVKEVVVTQKNTPHMQGIDGLAGRELYVRKSSSYFESLTAANTQLKKEKKKPMKIELADEVFEDEDLLEMLNAGIISTTIVDSHKAKFWAQIFDSIQIQQNAYVREDGEIAWAIRKNSPQLKAIVNEFIHKNKKGSLMGNMLFNRYLKNIDYIKNSASQEEIEKFQSMAQLFSKYAGEYDFDFLLLAAQAYQESGLDQNKKSAAGAIGVMQLLPSTAKDPHVNIPNIQFLEPNIHAGAKYMRYLADKFFKNEPMDRVNKMLFTFASYNAGPTKIQKVRERTKEMGLNPNIWFQNAELAAAEIIGQETVKYVNNIYKYYIAYKLTMKHREEKEKRRLQQQ